MEFDQYHEPPEELSPELRTKARLFASLAEEAEAQAGLTRGPYLSRYMHR